MQPNHRRVVAVVLVGLVLFGCNLPSNRSGVSPMTSPTMYIMTLSALQTRAVMTATAQGVSPGQIPTASTPAPIPLSGGTAGTVVPTGGTPAQGSVVINDTLCWRGPGPRYETISAIFKGTLIELLGRSLLPGWLIVRNPIYQDPCWLQASDVQIDPGINVNALPVYAIPVSPTPTPFPTRTPGAPTASPVPGSPTPQPTSPPPTNTPPAPGPTATAPAPTATAPAATDTSAPGPSPAPTGTP